MSANSLDSRLAAWRARAESQLAQRLDLQDPGTARLGEAMRYSTLGGGKRLRPVLVYCTGEALGAAPQLLDDAAAAVELLHVYSLVHDDLPAMDDDDLRRGRPTCHKAFDEATAILAGDSLQVLAFKLLASHPGLPPEPVVRVRIIETLADASGTSGMAGGQALDLRQRERAAFGGKV